MILQYEDIFSVFLRKVNELKLLQQDDSCTVGEMVEWLHSASASPRLRAKFSILICRDKEAEIEFELKTPVDTYSDCEFVKDIFARGMVIAWYEPQLNNVLLTKQMFGGKEEKYYSQAAHLKELKSVVDGVKVELTKLLRDYGYLNNSYLKE